MVCWLLAGCKQAGALTNEAPPISDQSMQSAMGPDKPVEPKASTAVDGESIFWQPDVLVNAAPGRAEWLPAVEDAMERTVWGIVDMRGFPIGQEVASNGVEYNPLFLLDFDFNIILWREQRLYLFADSSFWGQKAAPGVTNAAQGSFDFSKREFDFNVGAAWNYSGPWEARFFGYSYNNLNRGNSLTSPSGFNDGVGLENRFYLNATYAALGTAAFDQARATFLSVGYYPSKTMVDGDGNQFKPGPFARAYLTWDLWSECYFLYADLVFTATRSCMPALLNWDAGLAARPFSSAPRLEFRVGTQNLLDFKGGDLETTAYLAIRYVY